MTSAANGADGLGHVTGGELFLWLKEKQATDRAAARSWPTPRPITGGAGGTGSAYGQRALESELATLAGTQQGGRNDALNVAAFNLGQLVAGGELYDRQEVADALTHTALAIGLEAGETASTVNSGLNDGALQPRAAPALVTGPLSGTAQQAALTAVEPAAGQEPADVSAGWQPVDLAPFLDGSYRPPRPSLLARTDGLAMLYPGRVHWLSGEPEAQKSWLAQVAGAQLLATGERVVYLDLEDGAGGVTRRLLDLQVPQEQVLESFAYFNPHGPLTYARRDQLAPAVQDAALLVIDACTEGLSLQGLSSNSDVDVASWLEMLPRWAARLGPAVLVLDHVVKNAETRGRWATGSQHKLAGLDGVAFTLESVRRGGVGMAGRSRLYVEKDRHGQVRGPATVRSTGGRDWAGDFVVDSTGPFTEAYVEPPSTQVETFVPTVLMARISDALTAAGKPLVGREVEDRVAGKASMVRQALAALVDAGHVEVEKGHHNSRLHRLVRAYPSGEVLA